MYQPNPYAAVTEELAAQIPALQPSVVDAWVTKIMDDNPPDVLRDKARFENGKVKCVLWDWEDWFKDSDDLPTDKCLKAVCSAIEARLGSRWMVYNTCDGLVASLGRPT